MMKKRSVTPDEWNVHNDGPPTEEALRPKLTARGFRVTKYIDRPETVFFTHACDVDKRDTVRSDRFERVTSTGSAVLRKSEIACW